MSSGWSQREDEIANSPERIYVLPIASNIELSLTGLMKNNDGERQARHRHKRDSTSRSSTFRSTWGYKRSHLIGFGIVLLALISGASRGIWAQSTSEATPEIDITERAESQFIPISLEGYTGQVKRTLTFDLEIVGFKVVGSEEADYLLKGNNQGRLEGRLIDRLSGQSVFGKAYVGSQPRSQAHALADDVVEAVTSHPGIAQTKIAFKVKNGGTSELYVSDYDGASPVQITQDNSIVAAPTWAPGERFLYYTSYRANNPDLYAHNLETGSRRPVARHMGLNTGPAVSPDGSRLAMILSKEGSPDLFVGDRNGNNLRRLTYTRADESAPTWSPSGDRICFVSRAKGRADLYSISPKGGEMTDMDTIGVYQATEPAWSPDGKWIAFTTLRGGQFELCLLPANGGKGGEVNDLSVLGEDPSWAPNSRTLIFTKRDGGGNRSLGLLDVPTKTVKTVRSPIDGDYAEPTWERAR